MDIPHPYREQNRAGGESDSLCRSRAVQVSRYRRSAPAQVCRSGLPCLRFCFWRRYATKSSVSLRCSGESSLTSSSIPAMTSIPTTIRRSRKAHPDVLLSTIRTDTYWTRADKNVFLDENQRQTIWRLSGTISGRSPYHQSLISIA